MKLLNILSPIILCFVPFCSYAQGKCTIVEEKRMITTYPFSDPNPIPHPKSPYYPYYRFDGFALESEQAEWKVVTMENDYIRVLIYPEIGGKIWGAIEKSTGNEFIYQNSVVKFRDIAMRGAWTSGGIELNFGIIGHAPTCATPVDYLLRENSDGSVSCFVGAYDFLTRTRWETEINLQRDRAYFTTSTRWHNPTPQIQPYYQWMNAAYQVKGDLEFCFPGSHWIGHDGAAHPWPIDPEGRDCSFYKNNRFGGSKSNHVLGGISDFYAGYWHDLDFGSGHYSTYGEKLGMKVFQWAHSRSGSIWEDLLTDTDGQYVEMQSGRLFNQAVSSSTKTPFKHFGFEPYAADMFEEYWFPIIGTRGAKKANPYGILNLEEGEDDITIYYCALQNIDDTLRIFDGDALLAAVKLQLDVLETWSMNMKQSSFTNGVRVVLGQDKLVYSTADEDNFTNRPVETVDNFDWESVYGLFLDGRHLLFQRKYGQAEDRLLACIKKDPNYAPALNLLSALSYRKGAYEEGVQYARRSLSIDTYDAEANLNYGLNNKRLGNHLVAIDGFSVALLTPSYRSVALIELTKLHLLKGNILNAEKYCSRLLSDHPNDLEGNKLMCLIARKQGKEKVVARYIEKLNKISALDHFSRFSAYLQSGDETSKKGFLDMICCELPEQTFLEMSQWYQNVGAYDEAIGLLKMSPANALVTLNLSYLYHLVGEEALSGKSLNAAADFSTDFVLPFRAEELTILEWAAKSSTSWMFKYYLALLKSHFGYDSEAEALVSDLGSEPEEANFYLFKSNILQGNKNYDPIEDLQSALELDPERWRTYSLLIDQYLSRNDPSQALQIANEGIKKFPSHNQLKYQHARCLLANGRYTECKEALANTVILPSEGARYGRLTYRQACIMEALEYIEGKKYNAALRSAGEAKMWPENLGVGRPFQVDERIELFIGAIANEKKGNSKEAGRLFEQIAEYTRSVQPPYSSVDYLYLVAQKHLGNDAEVKKFLQEWSQALPDDPVLSWCISMIDGDLSKASKIADEINTTEGGTPWDPRRGDPEFEIVRSIGALI